MPSFLFSFVSVLGFRVFFVKILLNDFLRHKPIVADGIDNRIRRTLHAIRSKLAEKRSCYLNISRCYLLPHTDRQEVLCIFNHYIFCNIIITYMLTFIVVVAMCDFPHSNVLNSIRTLYLHINGSCTR